MVGQRQGPMGRRISGSVVGLQVYPSISNKRISIQPSIRRRRHDTSQNWWTIPTPITVRPSSKSPKHEHPPRPPIWKREKAQIRNSVAKQRATRKYNENLCPRSFTKGDLVWRMACSAKKKDGKFSANWDDSYQIREDAGGWAYKLEQLSSKEIPNTWNVYHLKFYFS